MVVGENQLSLIVQENSVPGSVTETAPKIEVGVFLSLAGVLIVLEVSSNIWVQVLA